MDRVYVCEALAKRNEINPFLKRMLTGNKKCVTYVHTELKRSLSKSGEVGHQVAKPEVPTRQVLLCIQWGWKGIVYYQQMDGLKLAIDQKRPELTNKIGIVFHQDILQATHICSNLPETPRAWLESFDTSTIQYGPSKQLSCFSYITKLPQ